ncbi:MAG TPA: nucleotide-binding protein [Thermoanaerobaculia bacterium]|jgi:hypothetical protein|nr:nucleotide-binding protein [Thermoanaerobaculia bacterium]
MKRLILFCTLSVLMAACGGNKETTSVAGASTKATVNPASAASAPAAVPSVPHAMSGGATLAPPAGKISGTVAETLDSGAFTYVRLTTDKGDQWVVCRQQPIRKGAQISVVVNMVADKFQSKTLKRTFDKLVFGDIEGASAPAGIPPHGQESMMPPHGQPAGGDLSTEALTAMMKTQHSGMAKGLVDETPIKVAKAEGSNAKTVAEIWGARATVHEGQPVVLHGKVVKFLPGIMGKNWLHLRDGSGSGEKGDNDITVTTSDVAAVGNVVLVSGVIHLNKDFGAGYSYPVIVEEAKVK